MKGRPAGATAPVRGDLNWRQHAICRDSDPRLFDSRETESTAITALRVCAGCPVRLQCRADAYATGDVYTIRGGTTGEERERVRVRQGVESGMSPRTARAAALRVLGAVS